MKHLKHRSTVVVLFLVLAVALVFTGLNRGPTEKANAALPTLTLPTIPVVHLLLASQWSPADGATGVAVDVAVTVHFNWDLKPLAIDDSTFFIQKAGSFAHLPASLAYSTVTDTATLTPSFDLLDGTTYHVTLTSDIQDKDGYNLVNAGSWSFTTDTMPQIVSRTPAANAVNVPLDQTVSVVFSKKMDTATFTNNSFYLKKSGGNKVLANIEFSVDHKTASIDPNANLEAGTVYEVTITPAVQSVAGILVTEVPSTWSFTTTAGAPAVTTKVPAADATGVPVAQTISATFDKDMDAATLTSATFYIQKSGGSPLPATVNYSAATRTATLDPVADLEAGAVYQVTLSNAVKGSGNIVLTGAPVVWSFTTVASAPAVTTKVPAAGATGVPVGQVVSATFDKDMDATTLTSATFYIQKSGGNPLPATVTYSAATRTASLDPIGDLEAGAIYQVTLSNAIKGAGNIVLTGAPVVWSFTTVASAPAVTTKVPAAGATGVPVGQVVSATFDKDMDATTLTSATFYILKSGGSPLPATVTYNAATRTVTLDPMGDLQGNATYQVTLSNAIKGTGGQTLTGAPVVWSFTTAGNTSSFTDVFPGVTPYSTAIAALAGDEIITGFPDGTFRPNDYVTRQQFAKMIVLTMGYTVTGAEVCPFHDVVTQVGTDPFYPSKYVAVCAAHGITQGKTPTTFAPYETITHQQLISMVARAATLSSPPVSFTPDFTSAQFSVHDHYLNARKASYAGLLDGLLGIGPSYNFLAGATRGECAQLLYTLRVLLGS